MSAENIKVSHLWWLIYSD